MFYILYRLYYIITNKITQLTKQLDGLDELTYISTMAV